MVEKNKNWKAEYEDIKNGILINKVSDALRENPKNWRHSLEGIGFIWVDDSQNEAEEEKHAAPENTNQEYLVAYFEDRVKFKNSLIDIFIEEAEADSPNYPLFRRYFKTGNIRLIQLLTEGLSDSPTNQTLLSGLSYFHENRKILSQLISIYTEACIKEQNIDKFKELGIDFSIYTEADGYDAIAELKSIFQGNERKLGALEEITKMMCDQDEVIDI